MAVDGLVFRYDEDEKVLRSVGDPPNGIVAVAIAGRPDWPPRFWVDGNFQPSGRPQAVLKKTPREMQSGDPELIDPDEAVEACAGEQPIRALWALACITVKGTIAAHWDGDLEQLRGFVGFLEELEEAVVRRLGSL